MPLSDGPPRGRTSTVIAAVAIAGFAGLAWGGPIMARMIADVDFPFHIETAESFAASGRITMPHFLLQVLLGSVVASGVAPAQQAAQRCLRAPSAVPASFVSWYLFGGGGAGGAGRASGAGGASGAGKAGGAVVGVLLALAVLMSAPILPRGE